MRLAVVATALTACRSGTPQPVADSSSDLDVRVHYAATTPIKSAEGLRVVLTAGADWRREVRGTDPTDSISVRWRVGSLPLGETVQITVAWLGEGGERIASVRDSLTIAPSHGYGLTVHPGGPNPGPFAHCRLRMLAAPMRRRGATAGRESLYVTVGARAKGSVC